jgi:hypothetical protein
MFLNEETLCKEREGRGKRTLFAFQIDGMRVWFGL